jgi:hypothetical protein
VRIKMPAAGGGAPAVLGPFWTPVAAVGAAVWCLLLVVIFGDLYRRDLRVAGKVGWTVVLVLFPYIGVVGYLAVHWPGLARRRQMRKDRGGPRRHPASQP